MINKLKSKLLILLSTVLMVLSFAFGVTGIVRTNNATAATVAPFIMKEGASIRKVEPTGIRFTAMISKDKYAQIIENGEYKDGYKVGMIIVPEVYFTDYDEQKDEGTSDYYDYFKNVKGQIRDLPFNVDQFVADEDDPTNYYNVNGAIAPINEENFDLSYQAVAYIAQTVGDKTTYTYSNVSLSRTVKYVAVAAINAGKLTGDEPATISELYGVNYAKVEIATDAATEAVSVTVAKQDGNITAEDVSAAMKKQYGYGIESLKQNGVAVTEVQNNQAYTAEVKKATVSGTLTSDIATFATATGANKMVFVRENGEKIVADVTKANGSLTYSATLPEGKYARASYVNFASESFTVTGEGEENTQALNVAFTTANNYVDQSLVSGYSANLLADGSVQAKPIAGTNSYVQIPDITFTPNKQTLTLGYSLTGMNVLGVHVNNRTATSVWNAAVGFCIGEAADETKGGGYNLFAANSAACPSPATRMAPGGSQIVDRAGITTISSKLVATWSEGKLLNWNSGNVNQVWDFQWVISGYNVNLYVKMHQGNQWITVFENRNLYAIYNGEVDIETADTNAAAKNETYLNALYNPANECNFGVTIRRTASGPSTENVCKVSNVWYNLSNNA